MSIENYYISCTHKVLTTSASSTGRVTKTYTSNTINGYIGQQINHFTNVAGKSTVETRYKFFSDTYTFANGDQIVYNSETYEVDGVQKNTANKSHHCKIFLKKIEGVTA